jgi:SAM-dependent methyltransferase
MMQLDPKKDYGFTDLWIKDTSRLPVWDLFRLEKIQEIFKTCPMILDFGNSSRALEELLGKDLGQNKKIFVDINECYTPEVVADICNMPAFQSNSIDGIICASILEHVYNPFEAAEELFRVLKPGGKMFVYVPWFWNYHAPETGEFFDYFRFSRDGVKYLFRKFSKIETSAVRGRFETVLNFFPKFGKGSRFHKWLGPMVRKFDSYNDRDTSGFNIYLIK